ncbi:glycosyltransferase family 4 protein [Chitinilyticum litopenaei]|uniref:glycosyltransferase family 4 protein n=1 Tax=Chitinilyticum litopenaei TaxID=1121276 RepID=UPI00040D8B1D|nr:glycosyltransferase family 4 protein [Chitinilyticum litopenaei]
MKIGFIDVTATVSFGGVQTAVWQLAMALHDLGHDVHVFGGKGNISPDLGGRAITIHRFAFTPREQVPNLGSRFRRIIERLSLARNARKTVTELDFDWLILTKPFDFFWPWLMPKRSRTRFCFMSGGTDFFRGDRLLAKRIEAWVACSHFNAWQIQHHYKRFPEVIYNGVDIAHFQPGDSTAMRRQLGITSQDFLLAFAGRLVGWKGLRIAIEALAQTGRKDIRLLIIGSGDAEMSLKALSARLNLQEQVIFHGPVKHADLPAYYAASDAGVFPSIGDEAFGITIAEAMACGIPVIGSHIGGIPEVIGNEEQSGLLVTPGSASALAHAILTLQQQPEQALRMGRWARKRIVDRYTWQQSAERLLTILEQRCG